MNTKSILHTMHIPTNNGLSRLAKHLFALALCLLAACTTYHAPDKTSDVAPAIYPDYTNLVVPPNIAPLNFEIQMQGESYQTEIGIAGEKHFILLQSSSQTVEIPQGKWRELLQNARGRDVYFRISILKNGKWTRYKDLTNRISKDTIDRYLVYRLLYPGYELWNEMGIYQRDITTFEQTAILENRDFGRQCVNCHSFAANSPQNMMLHIRGKQGGTLIHNNGKVIKIEPKPNGVKNGATYPAWHPSAKFIAFANNEIRQFFHISGKKPIEVSDLAADLTLYDVQANQTYVDTLVSSENYYETFPAWSPDGKTLYFCRARALQKGEPLDVVKYNLCSVRFDAGTRRFHSLKTVFDAAARNGSVSFPTVSPNGRYLMFTLSAYGNFSIWHAESDLWLLDLKTGNVRRIDEVNSRDVDSWHCWSSTASWFVFSSKRSDGGWARPYIAHFDSKTGKASKPFILPQRAPRFYDSFTLTFNRPELIKSPVNFGKDLLKAIPTEAEQAAMQP